MNRPEIALAASGPGVPPHPGLGFRAFVATMALLFALAALAIDSMLPAFPAITRSLALDDPNRAQWVLYAFLFGFGGGQLLWGPLADRYGRRAVLIPALLVFAATGLIAGFADSFATLLAARLVQGIAGAGGRVLATAIIRDCYKGRPMARVMSLSYMVFMIVPILAPSIGQAVLLIAPWPWIFYLLAIFGGCLAVWTGLRLPETLHPEHRRAISLGSLAEGARRVLGNRQSLGYTLAMAVLTGGMFSYLGSAQQIFGGLFGVPRLFPLIFAACAIAMSIASFVNSRIVERLGMRMVSHWALLAYCGLALFHLAITLAGWESLWLFAVLQAAIMAAQMLANSNFSALAMEPVGAVAGIASSVQGVIVNLGGTLLGLAVGQSFDGSTLPLVTGYIGFGAIALAIVLVVERGRLFHGVRPA